MITHELKDSATDTCTALSTQCGASVTHVCPVRAAIGGLCAKSTPGRDGSAGRLSQIYSTSTMLMILSKLI